MIHHDLKLVRMNAADGSLHCDKHGLLDYAEKMDVLMRAGFTTREGQAVDALLESQGRFWRWTGKVLEWWARHSRPRCVE